MSDHMRTTRTVHARKARTQSVVGVRELKTHAAQILRQVRDSRASYVVTHRGKAVGVILPIDEPDEISKARESTGVNDSWETFIRAGYRLERRFAAGASGVALLSGSRR